MNYELWKITERLDKTISQALSSVIANFTSILNELFYCDPRLYIERINQYESIGYLCFIESLLSCTGKERGMVEDAYDTYKCINGFNFNIQYSISEKVFYN